MQSNPRINQMIRSAQVRVISPSGEHIGVMASSDALKQAQQAGLDLIEITPNAEPPVCKIMDKGKFFYERKKQEQAQHKSAPKVKEIYLSVNIGEHDFMTKMRHATEFLSEHHPLRIVLKMHGREMEHKDLAFNVVNRAIDFLKEHGKALARPKLGGTQISVMLNPAKHQHTP